MRKDLSKHAPSCNPIHRRGRGPMRRWSAPPLPPSPPPSLPPGLGAFDYNTMVSLGSTANGLVATTVVAVTATVVASMVVKSVGEAVASSAASSVTGAAGAAAAGGAAAAAGGGGGSASAGAQLVGVMMLISQSRSPQESWGVDRHRPLLLSSSCGLHLSPTLFPNPLSHYFLTSRPHLRLAVPHALPYLTSTLP